MKKFILAVMMALPLGVAAQNRTFGEIIEKYEGQEGYTIVNMGPEMLSQAAAMAGDEAGAQLDSVMKDVKSFRLLTTENADSELFADIDAFVAEGCYQPLVSVNNGAERVRILTSDNSVEKEMLLIVQDGAEVVFIQVLGSMDVSDLMKHANMERSAE